MKKLILLLMLIIVVSITHAQVIRFKLIANTYDYSETESIHNNEYIWKTLENPVYGYCDINADRLVIRNKWEDDFILIRQISSKKEVDYKDDTYVNSAFEAMDNEGTKCAVRIEIWDTFNKIYIFIQYGEGLRYSYGGKKL